MAIISLDTSPKKPQWQGLGFVIIGAFCFSTVLIFTRLTHGLDAISIAFYRAFFAFLFFCLLIPYFSAQVKVPFARNLIGLLIGLGVAVGISAVLYVYAIQHTTAANAALLINSAPIYVAILAPLLLNEKRTKHAVLGLGLAVVGIVFISDPNQIRFQSASFWGILAGAISGFTFASTMLISRLLRGKVSGFAQALWSSGIASLVLLPWAVRVNWRVVWSNLLLLVLLGAISMGAAYFMYFLSLERVKAQVVSIFALFEPVSGVFIGLFFFKEYPNLLGAIGGILIIVSIFIVARSEPDLSERGELHGPT
jgi:drug/metabolite transporter (DMT)-like permease